MGMRILANFEYAPKYTWILGIHEALGLSLSLDVCCHLDALGALARLLRPKEQ